MKHTLIVAAFEGELEPLRAATLPKNVTLHAVGIGMVHSAVGMGRLLGAIGAIGAGTDGPGTNGPGTNSSETNVIFVGSVGAVDESTELLSLVTAESVACASVGLVEGRTYLPANSKTSYAADTALREKITLATGATSAGVYSPLGITSAPAVAELLALKTGAGFENLELFSIASACAESNILWTSIQAVTNIVGENGQKEWKENYQAAAKKTCEAVLKYLDL